jgi:MFS family permease
LRRRSDTQHSGFLGRVLALPTFRAFHYPQFRLLWYGQVGNGLSTWMDQVARGWLMYELTNSAVQLGAVTAIRAIPLLLFSPVAGAMADRYGRRGQLVAAQSVNAVLYGIMAALIYTHLVHPWHVYAIALGSAVVQVFQGPARQAMTSESVQPEDITNAVGVSSIAFNGSRLVGPAIAGVLIAVVGTAGAYVAQAVLYLVSTVWTVQLDPAWDRNTSAQRKNRSGSLLSSTLEGWTFVRHNETVRTGMIILMMAGLLAQPFGTMLPIYAKDILHAGSTGQGLLLSAMGLGAVLSAVVIASFSDRLPKGYMMTGACFSYGALLVLFAFSQWFVVSLILMVFLGLANVFSNALIQTVVQTHSPSEIRGRVMGIFQQRDLANTAGSMLIGALAGMWGAPWATALMGGTCALGAAAVYLLIPHARKIR